MEKEKLPPSSPHFSPLKPEPSASPSSSSPRLLENPSNSNTESNRFSHDVSRMPDFPTRNPGGHRRAHSEILSLPDDLTFDMVGPVSDETEEDFLAMYLDMDKIGSELVGGSQVGGGGGGASSSSYSLQGEGSERPNRVRHQHSQSMDGSMSIKAEMLGSGSEGPSSLAEAKKAMSAAKLADLALVDPKRAKRIWANRQSAARSKERKMRYIAELERRVQTLQTEATTLSAQLSMLQRDTTGLTAENNELKLRLQTMEQQVHLQDALNDALREEVQRLKMATGQMMSNGSMMNYGPSNFGGNQQQFYHHNNQAVHPLMAAQQLQQLQIHPQHPQHQHQHQYQHQQQQPPPDLRMRGPLAPQTQRENAANSSNAPMD